MNRSRVYALALRMMRNEAEAEELVQDTFLSAWQNLHNFRGDSAFSSWLHRICANFALMRLRRKRLEPQRLEEGEVLPEPLFSAFRRMNGLAGQTRLLSTKNSVWRLKERQLSSPMITEPCLSSAITRDFRMKKLPRLWNCRWLLSKAAFIVHGSRCGNRSAFTMAENGNRMCPKASKNKDEILSSFGGSGYAAPLVLCFCPRPKEKL